jgi:predicted transposase/invertase (TIGR01784 family)
MVKNNKDLNKNLGKTQNKKPKKIKSPHDGFAKRVLADPIIAQEFLEEYLPAHIKDKLDLTSLEVDRESHVSKSLRKRLSDIIYSVKTKNNDQAFIYCTIETQSSPDYWIAFRLWEYKLLLLERHMKDHDKLPIIIPLVLYNGKKKYNAPKSFWELFNDPLMAQSLMGGGYNLVDLEAMSDDQFNYNKALSLINYVMKHIHERDLLLMLQNAMKLCKTAILIDRTKNYVHLRHVMLY